MSTAPARTSLDRPWHPASPARRSALAVYLLGVLTGGAYLAYWMYGAVQTSDDERVATRPLAAAFAALILPVQAFFLFDLQRSSLIRRGVDPRILACAWPSLAALLLAAGVASGEWRVIWTATFVTAPIPFALVQYSLNRESTSTRRALSTPVRIGNGALALICAAASAWVFVANDMPVGRVLLDRPLSAGELVAGAEGLYQVRVPEDGWRRSEPGTFGDEDSDLELQATDGSRWIVGYVHGRTSDLEGTLLSRRSLLRGAGEIEELRERRYFAEGLDHTPVSIAHYDFSPKLLTRQRFVVFTAQLDEHVIEVIGYEPALIEPTSGLSSVIEEVVLSGRNTP